MKQYEKKGYLNSEFRLFHLTDQETKEIDYHYYNLYSGKGQLYDRRPLLRLKAL